MKKMLILASILAVSMTSVMATETAPKYKCDCPPPLAGKEMKRPVNNDFKKRKDNFDKRMKLTDKQKEQAKLIRQKGHEEMKPVMDKMIALKNNKKALVQKGKTETDAEMIKTKEEMKVLRKQMHELRKQNMAEFEAILTDKQKNELKKMKTEQKKNFEKRKKQGQCHKCKRPMGPPPSGK